MPRNIRYEQEVETAKRQQKKGLKIQFFILLILFLIPSLTLFRNADATAFQWENDHLVLNYPDDSVAILNYADILRVEYLDSFDFGTAITGGIEDQCRYGTWHNDAFGEYQVCCHTKIPSCIVFTTADTHFVISYESAETTKALFDSVTQTLNEQGYLTGTVMDSSR